MYQELGVCLILIGFYKSIPVHTEIRRLGGEIVHVGDFFEGLGETRANALIGWYSFQGTDNTGSFVGKGITKYFDTFLLADDDILQAFIKFGTSSTVSNFVINQMERYTYTCYLYGNPYNKNLSHLRYSLAIQDGKQGNELPPTLGALAPHIKRAFYMSLIWKNSVESSPKFVSPCDFGWFTDEMDKYHPIPCDKPNAPTALLDLKQCGCASLTGKRCSKLTCKCRKNGLH